MDRRLRLADTQSFVLSYSAGVTSNGLPPGPVDRSASVLLDRPPGPSPSGAQSRHSPGPGRRSVFRPLRVSPLFVQTESGLFEPRAR